MPFPGRDSDITVLNTWAAGDVSLGERRGTLASGAQRKPRYTIEMKSEPLLFELDELNLGQKVAEAWRDRIRDNVVGIAVTASGSTQKARAVAAKAFKVGAGWAIKRYGGGRMGALEPNQSNKLFNDSGRLADGIHVRANLTDSSYTVNFPSNRMNPSLFGPGFDAMVDRFVSLVPMLDPKRAFGDPAIEEAIKEGLGEMMSKAESNAEAAIARSLAKLRAARLKVLAQIAKLAAAQF